MLAHARSRMALPYSTTAAVAASAGASRRYRSSRSEEHTSELQSRQYLVCRLLLEKKNLTLRLTRTSDDPSYDKDCCLERSVVAHGLRDCRSDPPPPMLYSATPGPHTLQL